MLLNKGRYKPLYDIDRNELIIELLLANSF